MRKCPCCGFETEDDNAIFCEQCGERFSGALKPEQSILSPQNQKEKQNKKVFKTKRNKAVKTLCMVFIGIGILSLGFIVYLIYSTQNISNDEGVKYSQNSEPEKEKDSYQALLEEIEKEYGIVSAEPFITSDKTEIQPFPESSKGIMNTCRCDFDFDGEDEVLVALADQEGMVQLLLYHIDENGKYNLESQQLLGEQDPFEQIEVELFFNEKTDSFSVQSIQQLIGSYTGNTGFSCVLFTIGNKIGRVEEWEWTKLIDSWDDLDRIQTEMREKGIRHFHTMLLDFSDEQSENSYLMAKAEISVISGEIPTEYVVQMEILDYDKLLAYNSSVVYERQETSWSQETETKEKAEKEKADKETSTIDEEGREKLFNKIAAGYAHTLAVRSDGTVKAGGDNSYGRCNVQNWNEIVSVAAGTGHSVGLRADGTVVAVGDNADGQCNVETWTDIIAIAAGYKHTVGLRADGTVVAAGNNNYQQCNVSSWSGIKSIGCGVYHTLGILEDGTVIAVGDNSKGQCNVSAWRDILRVEGGYYHTVGLKENQTVVAVGDNKYGQCDVGGFAHVTQITCGEYCTIALTEQTNVLSAGLNDETRAAVAGWNQLSDISAANNHVAGYGADETIYEAGTGYSEELPDGIKFSNWR